MNGHNLLVDTNFLIYLLNGNLVITPYLNNHFFVSEITEMEMLGDRKSTRLNSSHLARSRMPSSA